MARPRKKQRISTPSHAVSAIANSQSLLSTSTFKESPGHLGSSNSQPQKLPRLPPTHKIHKRAPYKPSIPSPFTSSRSQKVVYITSKTPFISALKRTRKLLDMVAAREEGRDKWPHHRRAEALGRGNAKGLKGQVGGRQESAAKTVISDNQRNNIPSQVEVHEEKPNETLIGNGPWKITGGKNVAREEVVIKSMGRAIQRTTELGLWFQGQKEYKVRLRTGSQGVVDDVVAIDDNTAQENKKEENSTLDAEKDNEDQMEVDKPTTTQANNDNVPESKDFQGSELKEQGANQTEIPETRIRMVSYLEVGISWR